jgi:membrane protease YdiL (CAAX protease family)
MNRNRFQLFPPNLIDAGPTRQFIWLLILCLAGFSIASFLSVAMSSLIFGFSLTEIASFPSNPTQAGALTVLRLSQFLSACGLFLFPPVALCYLRNIPFSKGLHIKQKPQFSFFILAMVLMWVQLPLINLLSTFNNTLVFPEILKPLGEWMRIQEDQAAKLTEAFLFMPNPSDLVISLIIMALIPALGEEFLFRSTLQPLFTKWTNKPVLAIWITAFVFSFIHFQFFGFLPRFFIGAFLGYLFYWSGSVWYSVAAHFANNGLAVLVYYLNQHHMINFTTDELGSGSYSQIQVGISLCLIGFGLFLFKNKLQDFSISKAK